MAKRNQFRKTYNPYEHMKPQADAFTQKHSAPQEAIKEFEDAHSIRIDMNHPNALVTLAMLGRFFTEGAEKDGQN